MNIALFIYNSISFIIFFNSKSKKNYSFLFKTDTIAYLSDSSFIIIVKSIDKRQIKFNLFKSVISCLYSARKLT